MNDGWNEWGPRVPDPRATGSRHAGAAEPAGNPRPAVPPQARPPHGDLLAGPSQAHHTVPGQVMPPAPPPAWSGQVGAACPLPQIGNGSYGGPGGGTGPSAHLLGPQAQGGDHAAVPPQARFAPPETGRHLLGHHASPAAQADPATTGRHATRPALRVSEPPPGRLAVPQTGYHIVRFHPQTTQTGHDRPDAVPGRHPVRPPLGAGSGRLPEEITDRPLRWGDERILRRLADQGFGRGYDPGAYRPRYGQEPPPRGGEPYPFDDEAMDGPSMKVSASGEIARPFVTTSRRTRPLEERLRMETLLSSTPAALEAPLAYEHAHIVELCRRPQSVAEIAAGLRLPVGVARELIADLVTERFLIIHAQVVLGKRPPRQLLERIRAGVRAL